MLAVYFSSFINFNIIHLTPSSIKISIEIEFFFIFIRDSLYLRMSGEHGKLWHFLPSRFCEDELVLPIVLADAAVSFVTRYELKITDSLSFVLTTYHYIHLFFSLSYYFFNIFIFCTKNFLFNSRKH